MKLMPTNENTKEKVKTAPQLLEAKDRHDGDEKHIRNERPTAVEQSEEVTRLGRLILGPPGVTDRVERPAFSRLVRQAAPQR